MGFARDLADGTIVHFDYDQHEIGRTPPSNDSPVLLSHLDIYTRGQNRTTLEWTNTDGLQIGVGRVDLLDSDKHVYLLYRDDDSVKNGGEPVFYDDDHLRILTPNGGVHPYYWADRQLPGMGGEWITRGYDRWPVEADTPEVWPEKVEADCTGVYTRTGSVIPRLPREIESLLASRPDRDTYTPEVDMPQIIACEVSHCEPLEIEIGPVDGGRNSAVYTAVRRAFTTNHRAGDSPEVAMGKALGAAVEPLERLHGYSPEKARYASVEAFWQHNTGLARAYEEARFPFKKWTGTGSQGRTGTALREGMGTSSDREEVTEKEVDFFSQSDSPLTTNKQLHIYKGKEHDPVSASTGDAFLPANPYLSVPADPVGAKLHDASRLGALLDEIVTFNTRFAHHRQGEVHDLIALWVMHTYAMNHWRRSGRLFVNAPQAGSGKSMQAEIVQHLSNNGFKFGSQSASYIFRKIDSNAPNITLLIDEADNIWKGGKTDTGELQAIINDGYARGATVGRVDGSNGQFTEREYQSYAPMAIVGLSQTRLPATLLSRSFSVKMTLVPPNVELETFDRYDHEDYFESFRPRMIEAAKLLPVRAKPDRPDHLKNREWEIWSPLYVIAQTAGGDWPTKVEAASKTILGGEDRHVPIHTKVLRLALDDFIEHAVATVTPADLAEYIEGQEELYEVTGQKVSYWLKDYDVITHKTNGKRLFRRETVIETVKIWQNNYYNQKLNLTEELD